MGCKICHFEIPVDNVEKAKTFYEKLFGWKIERMPMGDEKEYFFIDTGDDLKGGLMKKIMPEHVPVNYILVPNVDEYANKCQSFVVRLLWGRLQCLLWVILLFVWIQVETVLVYGRQIIGLVKAKIFL